MATALEVAKYLLQLAEMDDESVTELRLHKLLYYVQGWSLSLNNEAIFPEQIQAWVHGPVILEVRRLCESALDHVSSERFVDVDESRLSDLNKDLIEKVWSEYRGFSAWALRNMTHREKPWLEARDGLEPECRSDRVIDNNRIKEFFRHSKGVIKGTDPKTVWEGESQIRNGNTLSLEQLKKLVNQ